MNEAKNIDKPKGNGVLPCVSGIVCCPLCGSENYEEYEELMYENGIDDPQYGGELKMVKITDCNVWCFAKAGHRRTNVELTTKDN
jgi:hypothetical protein